MSAVLDDIRNHLEFLGYRIEEKSSNVLGANHDSRWNFVFTEQVGGILLKSFIGTKDTVPDEKLHEFINQVHTKAIVTRFYLDSDRDLVLEAWWPNIYEKGAFGTFIDAWNQDIAHMGQHPDVEDLLV